MPERSVAPRHATAAPRDRGRRLVALAVALVALVASLPVLLTYLPYTPNQDLIFHLYRIDGIARGLADGQFPVRMQTVQVSGYGYPVSICYGDLFLYVPAVLRLMGLSMRASYGAFVLLVNAFCAAATYLCFRRMLSSRTSGLLACALWTLSPYRLLDDVWLRGAVGEYLALGFFPVIAFGVYCVFFPEREGAARGGWAWCSLGVAAVVYSHIISIVLAFVLFAPVVVALLVRRHDARTLGRLALAAAAALLLSLAFAVPFLEYYQSADMRVTAKTAAMTRSDAANNALMPAQLLFFLPRVTGLSYALGEPLELEMPFSVGWSLVLGALLWVALMVEPGLRGRVARPVRALGSLVLVLAVLIVFMSTAYFPWNQALPGPLDAAVSVLSNIQFPWRLLGPLSFALVFLACLAARSLAAALSPGAARVAVVALVALSCVEALAGLTSYMTLADALPEDYVGVDGQGGVASSEYLPVEADKPGMIADADPAPEASGDAEVLSWGRRGVDFELEVAGGETGGSVSLPLLDYPGYELVSEPGGCELARGDAWTLSVEVPAGFEGTVRVAFVAPPAWTASLAASAATLVGCVVVLAGPRAGGRGGSRRALWVSR